MESLVYLTVCVDQLRIVHSENIVDAYVNIHRGMEIFVTEDRHFNCWYVTQSAWLGTFLHNFSAVFNQKVLVVRHSVVENDYYVNI